MRWAVLVAVLIAFSAGMGLAQLTAAPPTLENSLQDDKPPVQKLGVVDLSAPNQPDPKAIRPAGTYVRPQNGVQDVDLDNAWAAYNAAIDKATSAIRDAIDKHRKAARESNDLGAATKYKELLEALEKNGQLPTEEKGLKDHVKAAQESYKDAAGALQESYALVIKKRTQDLSVDESIPLAVQKEKDIVFSDKPTAVGVWRWGKNAMVFNGDGTACEYEPRFNTPPVQGKWDIANGDVQLRLQNGFVVVGKWNGPNRLRATATNSHGAKHTLIAERVVDGHRLWRWFTHEFVESAPNGDFFVNGVLRGQWKGVNNRVLLTWDGHWVDTLILNAASDAMKGRNQNGDVVSAQLIDTTK